MSSYPQPLPGFDLGAFNAFYFSWADKSLTLDQADHRYLHLTGGHITGSLSIDGSCDMGSLKIGGSIVDLSALSGTTHGLISADKAVIVDANKDISAFRNLTATGALSGGSLSLTGSSPTMNLSAPTGVNNSMIWTGGAQPTNMNGIGIRFVGLSSTGSIRSYNYVLGQFNAISLNDDAIRVAADGKVGISKSSPAYALDIAGASNASSYRVGGGEVINSSGVFVGSGGVDITNRIYLKNNGYGLSIRGNTSNNDTEIVSLVDGGGGHLGTYTSHALSLMTGNTDRVRVFPSGTVSIGTNAASNARLYLTSGINSSTIPGSDTIQKIERTGFSQPLEPVIVSNPSLICSDNIITYGALFVASDRRLKRDIRPCAEGDALRFVRDVEPIRYRLKSGDNRDHYGYVAQQLMEHQFGELIDIQADQNMEDEGDEYDLVGYRLSIDYSRSCVLLHRAMQRMLAMLEEQQATIDKLESKLG